MAGYKAPDSTPSREKLVGGAVPLDNQTGPAKTFFPYSEIEAHRGPASSLNNSFLGRSGIGISKADAKSPDSAKIM